jgi:hypothetical protein
MVVELVGGPRLLDPAFVHHDQLLGDVHRLLLVMGDEDRRHVHLLVEAAQPGAQVLADLGVEGAEGLVEQQHLRFHRQCPSQRHALPLAAGELVGIALGEPVELDQSQQLVHSVAGPLLAPLADLQAEGDVAEHGHVLEGGVVLEDEADLALLRRRLRGVLAVDHDRAGVEILEPGDRPQQRRLAAAARPEQRRQRAVRHVDRDVVERLKVTEALVRSLDCDSHQEPSLVVDAATGTSVPAGMGAPLLFALRPPMLINNSVVKASRARTTAPA